MAVYVDNMERPLGRLLLCHMIASTRKELHEMADKIGVARRHYHDGHYNICKAKKALAVRHGAIAVTQKQLVALATMKRETGRELSPEDAEYWLRERLNNKRLQKEQNK